MKYTIVDKDTCIGCGACSDVAPEIFCQDAKGNSHALLDNNKGTAQIPEELHDDLYDAYEGCPSESIKIADNSFDGNPNKFE
ncbi:MULTISPECIES: ferredoxin [Lysinibacillus]|uniref:ferredoxin n=1 Tax=Lysinibacillus TaxID=400634 RepID=UPI00257FDB81|nr:MULTISPECIES: ferredoxin [Lysinibacillus]